MNDFESKALFYKALGEPIRLMIIKYLLEKEGSNYVCICHISKHIKRDQSVVFRHIQVLKTAGIVSTEKKDKFLFCFINDKQKIKRYMED